MPLAAAHHLARNSATDAALYAGLEAALETKTALLEEYTSVLFDDISRARIESGELKPYEIGGDPPWVAPSIAQPLPPDEVPKTSATHTSFETKQLGLSMEVDADLGWGKGLISCTLGSERITFAGWLDYGGKQLTNTPLFTRQALNTGINLTTNRPTLLGTMSPPPSAALKPGTPETRALERVWFAFVTIRE